MYTAHRADQGPNGLTKPADRQLIEAELAALRARLDSAWLYHVGFPGTSDLQHSALGELLTQYLLNNIGDPFEDGLVPTHTKSFERRVLDLMAQLFRAPASGWWGCVTGGSSEGTLHALWTARRNFPDTIVLHSKAAHYSVPKAADILALPTVAVAAGERGEMDYDDLRAKLRQHRHRRPIIVASAGTFTTEAVDDVGTIAAVCDELGIADRFIHTDAALSGVPLAVAPPRPRPRFDLADGADSIVTSGHKVLSTLMPSGVVLIKSRWLALPAREVGYISGHDTTIPSSRNGHLALLLWEVLRRLGIDGLRVRAVRARQMAEYATQLLTEAGWPAWRHPHGFTVVLRTPASSVTARWSLPPHGDGWSHLVCMPGVTRYQIDMLVKELREQHALVASQAGQ